MKNIQRQAITAAGLLAVVFAPTQAMAQGRGAAPVPIFVAVTFKSPGEPKLGVDVAEAIRQRMVRFFPQPAVRANQLRIVTQKEINDQLVGSGYPADSAITTTDLRDLGRGMGANESMEGSVKRTAAGVEARARFYLLSNIDAPEVLPLIVDKDAGAVGRKIAEEYVQARKELPEYEKCKNALIQRNPDAAIVAAQAAMVAYSKGVLPRACMLTAYGPQYKKFPADSIIRLATEIVSIDADNEIAIGQLVDAYRTKGDTGKAIEMSMRLYTINPNNMARAQSIIDLLASSGAPDKALTIVEDMMKNNPGDAAIIETQWKLLQATSQWKRAIAAGEEMVKFDTAKADTAYFRRQIAAAYQDSQPQLALQFLGRVTAKFPRDVRFLQGYLSELVRQGQLQQALEVAKKVIAVDPRADQGYSTVVSLYTRLGQGDSAVVFARSVLTTADSAGRAQIGAGLLSLIAPSMNKAQKEDSAATPDVARENWTQVYKLSAAVDSIVPQAATAFYMSFAAFNLANNAVQRVAPLAQARNNAAACAELKTAADMILAVDLNMGRGGRFNGQGAAQILQAASTLRPYIAENRQRLSCRP